MTKSGCSFPRKCSQPGNRISGGSIHKISQEIELEPFALMIHREEVYADRGEEEIPQLVSLEALGDVIV